ncbi:MAG: PEGA domain-containing protein [Myxococcales bacterium]|nr:MAG: PEGA domain-containing protein [Myxococcales bacterium]
MSRVFYSAFFLLLILGGTVLPSKSQAKGRPQIAVLGIQSMEGDDDYAHRLSIALRSKATQVSEWNVLRLNSSIQQLSLAHGCTNTDNGCLTAIARSLGVDTIIYGILRRSNHSGDFDFLLSLQVFSLATRHIEFSINRTISPYETKSGNVDKLAAECIAQLVERPNLGSIAVEVLNTNKAEVRISGNLLLSSNGKDFTAGQTPIGKHKLVVSAPGYETLEKEIEVDSHEQTQVRVTLIKSDSSSGSSDTASSELVWLGWGSIALGGVFLGLSGYSMLRLYTIDHDADLVAYRELPGLGSQDVCQAAANGFVPSGNASEIDVQRVTSLCDEADTLEVLQYVFLGLGIAGVGAGITMLVINAQDDDHKDNSLSDEREATFALQPSVGRNRAMLNAFIRF